MRAFLQSQKGSSTVLIALLMIVLVVFGLLSLTTTASELKLAKRNAESHKDYYALDSEGAKFVHHVRLLVEKALEEADRNYEEAFYLSMENLLEKELPHVRRETLFEEDNRSIRLYKSFALENSGYTKYLSITLDITEPGQLSSDDSLTILEWRLWQEPFEYHNTHDLWEGIP